MLSSDVLKLHQGRSPFTAQRRAAANGMDPRHARVLQLQRDAGNKAVTQMVAAQRQAAGRPHVQRAFSTTAGDLARYASSTGTYARIVKVVRDFDRARDPQIKSQLASLIRALSNVWLKDHPRPSSRRERMQRQKIELLEAESFREIGVLAAQAKYLKGFDDVGPVAEGPRQLPGVAPDGRGYLQSPFDEKKQFGQFGALSTGAKLGSAAPAKSLAEGRTHKAQATQGAGDAALRIATKYKLSAAEIAAIRTYSFTDYSYINPATSNNRGRVEGNLESVRDPSLNKLALKPERIEMAMKEGAMHAGVLMQALAKIEPFTKKGYRGERLTMAEFHKRYMVGAEVTGKGTKPGDRGASYSWFGSASKRRNIAVGYSMGTSGDVRPKPNQTVSVMVELELTNARDIEKLSGTPRGEYEVLILPGAKFVITELLKMPETDRVAGDPKATHWAIVRMKQIA